MRSSHGPALLVPILFLATAGAVREAHAIGACTAAQISAADPSCPSGSGPCTISKNFEIANGCTLDFGTRAVTLSGTLDIASGSVIVKAGSFTIAPGGKILGMGDHPPPNNVGGKIRIETTGIVNVQSASSVGRIDVSANSLGGDIVIVAGGTVTIAGRLTTKGLQDDGLGGGNIEITSKVDIITTSTSVIDGSAGTFGLGGTASFDATGKIDLGGPVDMRGGDGGDIDVFALGDAIVRDLDSDANGDAGSGGFIDIFGKSVQVLGVITTTGSVSILGDVGGDGGEVTIEAEFGDVTFAKSVFTDGAGPDGGGGAIDVLADAGSINAQAGVTLSSRANGSFGTGGEIDFDAAILFTSSSVIDCSGGDTGGDVYISAGRDVTLISRVDASGRNAGSYGGTVFVEAGVLGKGNLLVNDRVDVRGGDCTVERGCGLGGFIDLLGCDLTLSSTAQVLARAASAGANGLTAREQLRIDGEVNATRTDPSGLDGTNTFIHPSGKAPIVTGTVAPPAQVMAKPRCTATGQTGCLVPCPTCGNSVTEFPETCDNNSGTPVSCDGCSAVCQTENCNDANGCTTDSCDPSRGCRHQTAPPGATCSDGNVCNGSEVCNGSVCVPGTSLNCNDGNACTDDSCNPASGCVRVNNSLPCNDGLFCNGPDTCSAGSCSGHAGNPCPGPDGDANCAESCNEAADSCTAADPNGSSCNDGLFCNGTDACSAGSCAVHAGDPCPGADGDDDCSESCDEGADACTAADPDGLSCPGGTCQAGLCNGATTTTTTTTTISTSTVTTTTVTTTTTSSTTTTTIPAGLGHLKCYKVKDPRAKTAYTLDLMAGVGGFPDEAGCAVKLRARRICVEVDKQGVTPPAPGGGPVVPPNAGSVFLSYKLKCPRQTVAPTTLADQFGAGSFTIGTATELLVPASPGPANDHFKCYKAKDARPKASFTLDLLAGVAGFTDELGCTVKLGAKRICVQVTKQNVVPAPPGGGPGPGPGSGAKFVSYKLKCPKQVLPAAAFADQFGGGNFTPVKAAALLVPAS